MDCGRAWCLVPPRRLVRGAMETVHHPPLNAELLRMIPCPGPNYPRLQGRSLDRYQNHVISTICGMQRGSSIKNETLMVIRIFQ